MNSIFSKKEKEFIQDMLNGNIGKYKRSYACRLRQRCLQKGVNLCENLLSFHSLYLKEFKRYTRYELNNVLSQYQALILQLKSVSLTPWTVKEKEEK